MDSGSISNLQLIDITKVVDDIIKKKGVCLNEILNYLCKIYHVPKSRRHEVNSHIVRILNKAEEEGLIRKSSFLYKVSSYGKSCLNDKHDSTRDESDNTGLSDGDYAADDSSSCNEDSNQQNKINRNCNQCCHTFNLYNDHGYNHNSPRIDDINDDLNKKLQSIRDYESSSGDSDGNNNIQRCDYTRTGVFQKMLNCDNIKSCDRIKLSTVQGKSNNTWDDFSNTRRCCTRFKKCKRCGERKVIKRKDNISRPHSSKNTKNNHRKICKRCEEKIKSKRKRSCNDSNDSSVSSHSKNFNYKKSNQSDRNKSKTSPKNNPRNSPNIYDKNNRTKDSNETKPSQNIKENKQNENDDKKSQITDDDTENIFNYINCNRGHCKRHKKTSGRSKEPQKKHERKKRKPGSDSDKDSKNPNSKKRKRSNATPPPPFLDPTAKPGKSGIERKASNSSNTSLPYYPPSDPENEKEEGDSKKKNTFMVHQNDTT